MKSDQDRYFRTTSFSLAAFLYCKQQQVAGINPTIDSSKKEFSFVRSEYLEELVDSYKFGEKSNPELLVPVHLYEQARNELLDLLNE